MVFGGRVLLGPTGQYNHGHKENAALVIGPRANAWTRVPKPPPLRYPSVAYARPPAGSGADAWRSVKPGPVHWNARRAPWELPFVAADVSGLGHWFVHLGSIFLDPRTLAWGQKGVSLSHGYPWNHRLKWVEEPHPTWVERSQGATATGPDGRIYLVGGNGKPLKNPGRSREVLKGLDIYDPAANTWRRGPDMKIARQSLAAAFGPNGKLYVFGGCECRGAGTLYTLGDEEEKRAAEQEVERMRRAVAVTEVYDPKTDRWSEAAPMPNPRMLFAAATGADGRIYLIGGGEHWSGRPSARVDVYDPERDRWSRGPDLRHPRSAHAAAVTGDGTIWVIGGYVAEPGLTEIGRLMSGDKGGPTASVELLKTEKRK